MLELGAEQVQAAQSEKHRLGIKPGVICQPVCTSTPLWPGCPPEAVDMPVPRIVVVPLVHMEGEGGNENRVYGGEARYQFPRSG